MIGDITFKIKEDGIYKYTEITDNQGREELIISKDMYVEAYDKWIKSNDKVSGGFTMDNKDDVSKYSEELKSYWENIGKIKGINNENTGCSDQGKDKCFCSICLAGHFRSTTKCDYNKSIGMCYICEKGQEEYYLNRMIEEREKEIQDKIEELKLTRARINNDLNPTDSIIDSVKEETINDTIKELEKIKGRLYYIHNSDWETSLHADRADGIPLEIKQNKCNNCKNNTDELSSECYECVKEIKDWYDPIFDKDKSVKINGIETDFIIVDKNFIIDEFEKLKAEFEEDRYILLNQTVAIQIIDKYIAELKRGNK